MSEYVITSTDEPDPDEVLAVRAALGAYNDSKAGSQRRRLVHMIVRDAEGMLRGGLLGRQMWEWLYVEILWLDEPLRGKGIGRRLLGQAEAEARAAGATRVMLDTFEFQALPFYQKMGYSVFGTLDDFPEGFKRFYLTKRLG